jgi:hypothetical protein
MRWAGLVAGKGDKIGAFRVLVERPEERRPLGRRTRRLENNSKMNLQQVRRGEELIDLSLDGDRWRVFVNVVMNIPVL